VVVSNELKDRRERPVRFPLSFPLHSTARRSRRSAIFATLFYAAVAALAIVGFELATFSFADGLTEMLSQMAEELAFVAVTGALVYTIVGRVLAASAERERRLRAALAESYEHTLTGWARALELRDHETEGHSARVTELAVRLAVQMGLRDEALEALRRGAMLHDIGKIGVPDAILHKPGPLADDEWAVMRRHPEYAYDMLAPIGFLRPVLDIPYCHHERWDGSGYPRGLAGEAIPLAARIFAVVDVWDALRSDRPYRTAWSRKQAIGYLKAHAGNHFDPDVVRAFTAMIERERQLQSRPTKRVA
jgi:HD-GYP domain-containing protein (c-di-GMP phosphodiesterase class II)